MKTSKLWMGVILLFLAASCSGPQSTGGSPTPTAALPATVESQGSATSIPTGQPTLESATLQTSAVVQSSTPAPSPTETASGATAQPASDSGSTPTAPAAPGLTADIPVFRDGLSSGWSNWSWDTDVNLGSQADGHLSPVSISVMYKAGWGALYLHTGADLQAKKYVAIKFWANGGKQGGQKVAFKVMDADNSTRDAQFSFSPATGAWKEFSVELTQVGSPTTISGLVWQDNSGGGQPQYFIDDISLVERKGPPPPTETPSAGPSIRVDASSDRHPISPYIYGMNFADEKLAAELQLPVRRWGGNSTTRYNWQNDMNNKGSDWYFENIAADNPTVGNLPDGSAADRFVEQDRRTHTQSLLTIPMIGWVPKQRLGSHPFDCGFKVAKYGKQKSVDPYDESCGNGVLANGGNVTGSDPKDTSIPAGPDFIQAWIQHLIKQFGPADKGGVQFYNLDNEPTLWPYTHRDVHPQMTTYDELVQRTIDYGSALKKSDPAAQTLGPVDWGWCAYFYSALDNCKPGSDYSSHNNTGMVEWYLQKMNEYEQKNGVRLLDYLDLHIYPQGEGVYSDTRGGPATEALRLRSTRSLWDRSYTDESWIKQPIYLIPRMRDWVEKDYPGTKLAITEYNWGALGDINGALAEADILGIFGREGLDLATLWGTPDAKDPGAFAFRMYLNYDKAKSKFGDVSVHVFTSDQDKLAVYAAQRSSDKALTLMVINKTGGGLTSTVALANFTPGASGAKVYRYGEDDLTQIVHAPDIAVGAAGFTATFPANSITLVVIPGD